MCDKCVVYCLSYHLFGLLLILLRWVHNMTLGLHCVACRFVACCFVALRLPVHKLQMQKLNFKADTNPPSYHTCWFKTESDEDLESVLLLTLYYRRRKRNKKKRSIWVRPVFVLRRQQGAYHNLLQEMRLSDPELRYRYLRMSKERFDCLLAKVRHIVCIIMMLIKNRLVLYYIVNIITAHREQKLHQLRGLLSH